MLISIFDWLFLFRTILIVNGSSLKCLRQHTDYWGCNHFSIFS